MFSICEKPYRSLEFKGVQERGGTQLTELHSVLTVPLSLTHTAHVLHYVLYFLI